MIDLRFNTQAFKGRRVVVVVTNGCTGSPNCVAEIQIGDASGPLKWHEAHLDEEEVKKVIEALKGRRKAWKKAQERG